MKSLNNIQNHEWKIDEMICSMLWELRLLVVP